MNTEKTEARQPTDTPQAIDHPARPKPGKASPGRRIDASTIAEMAKLCAKMLTESESCRRLGIKPRTWFDFKSRAGRTEHFGDMVEAYRAARIEQLIERIEKSADGADGVKYPDWRAALALLKITDLKRFGDSPAVETGSVNNTLAIFTGGEEGLRRMIAAVTAEVHAEATTHPKAIIDCPPATRTPPAVEPKETETP